MAAVAVPVAAATAAVTVPVAAATVVAVAVLAVAVVVGADAPPVELWAAEEVGRCLVEALGARLVKPGEGAALTVELVRGGGESYEIEVSRGPARVAVRGASGADLRDGAFAFLEKAVGARWLFPGEEGEWIPRLDELRLRPGRWAGPKGMPYRGLHICGSPHHYDKAGGMDGASAL